KPGADKSPAIQPERARRRDNSLLQFLGDEHHCAKLNLGVSGLCAQACSAPILPINWNTIPTHKDSLMLHKNRLFTPGPTPLLPAAQTAMASFTAHHRTADFKALFQRVLADMKEFIGTKNDVLVLASSGTGVMEASVLNLTSAGDRVLVLTAGKFGERWTGLAKAFGCNVDVLSMPYGETFSLDDIRARLNSDIRAVYVQATESSTGARHDIEGIAKLVRAHGDQTLLIVDAITGLGTTHFDV